MFSQWFTWSKLSTFNYDLCSGVSMGPVLPPIYRWNKCMRSLFSHRRRSDIISIWIAGAGRGGNKKGENSGRRHSRVIEIGGLERGRWTEIEIYREEAKGSEKRKRERRTRGGGSVTIAVFAISSHPVIRPPRRSLLAASCLRAYLFE